MFTYTFQSSTNVVVVQQQPQPTVTTTVYTRHYGSGDHGLVYAIIASCIVFWCAGWIGLFCTIPAIFIAINVSLWLFSYLVCLRFLYVFPCDVGIVVGSSLFY